MCRSLLASSRFIEVRRTLLVITVLALLLAACRSGQSERKGGTDSVEAGGVRLPNQLLGLQVKPEDVSGEFGEVRRSYIASLGLFSLRENDLVRATLQVSRFNSLARPSDRGFRNSVINRLGTTKAQTLRVGDTSVYVTSKTDQQVFAWFEGRGFFVVTTHRDYEFPRTLLRRIIDAKSKLE
jgi:hypothetical protein